ncbi:serine hydrolase domain-containing protein [Croceicoccus hydrothermalis]|uniref:serine hydrolase domain-containing protein n=1 Tax=Croceicoccus hydrothermalis TaxID=2867964 RepID=UPI001EFA8FC9|nr:serine hydrolase [Croceicoccus hydrothermalis]
MMRRLPSMLALLCVPALAACSPQETGPQPPSTESRAAIAPGAAVPREKLAYAIDDVFAERAGETRALLILHDGKVVAERYADGYDADTAMIGWSMSKTVTGVLIGMLIADGALSLDQPAPIPAWQRPGDPRGDITIRHLLQMRSGLRHAETASPAQDADTVRMLAVDGRDDMAAYAETQPLDHTPGAQFNYATPTSVILADIAARALTRSPDPDRRRDAMHRYLQMRLFDPVGMDATIAEYDRAGTMIGGSMIHAPARDWAKFGEMLRLGGMANGAQIVPRGWVRFMTTSSPGDPAYGGHVWLNHPRPEGRNAVLFPADAPDTLFAALGHRGQFTIVSPEQKLTIVRLGNSDRAQMDALNTALREIVTLFPIQ